MLTRKFGIEIEFTGITREQAACVAAGHFGGFATHVGGYYDAWQVKDSCGRDWKFVSDSSIKAQVKQDGRRVPASDQYKVELVSPILTYREDIDSLQELVRKLRGAGGFCNASAGIHVHLDGAGHTPRSIRNFINIIAARKDLFYKALQIKPDRMRFCKKMDAHLVERMNRRKPKTMEQIREIWYEGYYGSCDVHYHESRYRFLNLHSFFQGNHTIELRGYNSVLHAGKIRSYIVFSLALNHQALTQASARSRACQMENEKFSMRVYLNRIGFIGEEFKNCREHLYMHLAGNAAWRYRTPSNVPVRT